jgi:hypothetical protein
MMLRVALDTDVRTFSVERSARRNSYLNFLFVSSSLAGTWRAVEKALNHRTLGRALQRSTIVVCQGTRGWNNYRQLHHFNNRKPIDKFVGV